MLSPIGLFRAVLGGIGAFGAWLGSVAVGFGRWVMRHILIPFGTHMDAHTRKAWRVFGRAFVKDGKDEDALFEELNGPGTFFSSIFPGLLIWPIVLVLQFIRCNFLNAFDGIGEGFNVATAKQPAPAESAGSVQAESDAAKSAMPGLGRAFGIVGRVVGFLGGLFTIGLLAANVRSLFHIDAKVFAGLDQPMYTTRRDAREAAASATLDEPGVSPADQAKPPTHPLSAENFTWHWFLALPGVLAGIAVGVVRGMLWGLVHNFVVSAYVGMDLIGGVTYEDYMDDKDYDNPSPTWAMLPLFPVALAGLVIGSALGMVGVMFMAMPDSYDYFNSPFPVLFPVRKAAADVDAQRKARFDELGIEYHEVNAGGSSPGPQSPAASEEKPAVSWGQWFLHGLRTVLWYVLVGPFKLAAFIPGAVVGMGFAMLTNSLASPGWAAIKAYRSFVAPERANGRPFRVIVPLLPVAAAGVAIGSAIAFLVLTGLSFLNVREFFNQPVSKPKPQGAGSPDRAMSRERSFEVEHGHAGVVVDEGSPKDERSSLAKWWSRRSWTELLEPIRVPFYILGTVLAYMYLVVVNLFYVSLWAFRSAYRDELKGLIKLNASASGDSPDMRPEAEQLGPFGFMALDTPTNGVTRAVFLPPLFVVALIAWWVGTAVGMIRAASFAASTRFAEWNHWATVAYNTPENAREESKKAVGVLTQKMEAAGKIGFAKAVREGAGVAESAPKPVFPWYTSLSQLLGGLLGVCVALAVNAWRIGYEVARGTTAFLYTSDYEERGKAIRVTSGSRMMELYNTRYFPNQVDANHTRASDRLNASTAMWLLMSLPVVAGVVAGVLWSALRSVTTGLSFGMAWTVNTLLSVNPSTEDGYHNAVDRYQTGIRDAIGRSQGGAKWVQLPIAFMFKAPFFLLPAAVTGLAVSIGFMAVSFVIDVVWQLLAAVDGGLDNTLFGVKLPSHFYSSQLTIRWGDTHMFSFNHQTKSGFRAFWRFPGLAVGFVVASAVGLTLTVVRSLPLLLLLPLLVFGAIRVLLAGTFNVVAWCLGRETPPFDQEAKIGSIDLSKHFNVVRGFVFDATTMYIPRNSRWFSWLRGFRDHMLFDEPSIADRTIKAIKAINAEQPGDGTDKSEKLEKTGMAAGVAIVTIEQVLDHLKLRSGWRGEYWFNSNRALKEEEIEAEQVVVAYNNAVREQQGEKIDPTEPPPYESLYGYFTNRLFAPPEPSAPAYTGTGVEALVGTDEGPPAYDGSPA